MTENLRWRLVSVIIVFVVAIVWTAPNFINISKIWWPTRDHMTMGLDIQGGLHLVMRVDVDGALRQSSLRLAQQMKTELAREKVDVSAVNVKDALRGEMEVLFAPPANSDAIERVVDRIFGSTVSRSGRSDTSVTFGFTELHVRDFKRQLLDQAIATIRNRIDEFGVAEPSITAQGEDRLLVQLPGIQDAANAKDLINRTAKLEWIAVDESISHENLETMVREVEATGVKLGGELKYSAYVDKINAALKGKIPEGSVVYFEKLENADSMEAGRRAFLLKSADVVTGDRITDAHVGANQYGAPIVNFALDVLGTREFGELTKRYTQKQMAIVLDRVVKSAPVINEPITGGRGMITLGRGRDPQASLNEAKFLSTTLKAGALPAALEQLEERTVGPSLGQDAIRKGQMGGLIGAALVFIFMAFYYRSFGIIADISLALNLLMTVAILSALNATLTLPGIAGLALGLGISVDASVIIYERIKEEMARGLTLSAAISEGYDRAFSSIFDANVTSIAVSGVLMYFGTGPVRGFAITLTTGLVITLFTAVFFTRSVLDLLINRWKLNLSIHW